MVEKNNILINQIGYIKSRYHRAKAGLRKLRLTGDEPLTITL